MKSKFSGLLYQLCAKRQLADGTYVAVNGPHDTFGVVQQTTLQPGGEFLHLIRGVKQKLHDTPAHQF